MAEEREQLYCSCCSCCLRIRSRTGARAGRSRGCGGAVRDSDADLERVWGMEEKRGCYAEGVV